MPLWFVFLFATLAMAYLISSSVTHNTAIACALQTTRQANSGRPRPNPGTGADTDVVQLIIGQVEAFPAKFADAVSAAGRGA